MTTCKNCDFEFKGKFCPACGQKAKTGRITFWQVFQEARQHVIHFDQGFLYTMKELAIRPGNSVRSYLEGRRVKHIKPLKFLFWTLTISFLVFHYAGLDQLMTQQMTQQPDLAKGKALTQKLMPLLMNHPAAMMFTMIPFLALCSWLLFRRKSYNYAEHFVISAYLMAELSLFSVIVTPLIWLFGDLQHLSWVMGAPSFLIWICYFGWAYGQFFQTRSWWVRIKGVLVIALGYLLMIIFTSLMIGIVVFLFRHQLEAWLQH